MKIFENLIPKAFQDRIEEAYFNDDFPWYLMEKVAYVDDNIKFKNSKITNPLAFAHAVYGENQPKSNLFHVVYPILHFLEQQEGFIVKNLIRIRSRLTLQIPNHGHKNFNTPHVDMYSPDKFKTLIYYVNDSDGDTILFKEKFEFYEGAPVVKDENITIEHRISPKKGRAVLFDGHQFHAGNSPIDTKKRIVINFDFFIE